MLILLVCSVIEDFHFLNEKGNLKQTKNKIKIKKSHHHQGGGELVSYFVACKNLQQYKPLSQEHQGEKRFIFT